MTSWVAATTSAILPTIGALSWALFVLIAVMAVTAVFSPIEHMRDDAKEVLRIMFGRRPG